MATPIFITGIGTDVGKTVVSAIVTEALRADYWKPVQAGFEDGTDSLFIKRLLTNTTSVVHPEAYKLSLPASPHIAAREEDVRIDLNKIKEQYTAIEKTCRSNYIVIEGAGGLLVPLNEREFVIDLIKALDAYVIIVSRNYLGSVNHSLLTAQVCQHNNLKVLGLIFNGEYMNYQQEIVDWSGFPSLGSVPNLNLITKESILQQSVTLREAIVKSINLKNEEART